MNDIKPRKEFFRDLQTQTINEIKDDLLKRSQDSITTYNEIVSDYKAFIYGVVAIDAYTSYKVTVQEFTDYRAKELAPFTADEILQFDFEFEPPYRLVFDLLTIEPNSIKLSQLNVSFEWDKQYISRGDYEKARVNIARYVYQSFKFREACKMVIAPLMGQTNSVPEPQEFSTFENKFDSVNESKVLEYFTKNLVDKKYLSKETLNNYLKQAFELETPPAEKFSFEKAGKMDNVKSVFYKYYQLAQSPYGKQPKYLDLLKNYFVGFEKLDPKNFSK